MFIHPITIIFSKIIILFNLIIIIISKLHNNRDIFPVLRDPVLYDDLLNIMAEEIKVKCPKPDAILGLESRGFLFAPSLALKMKTAFVPVRKAGKLPGETFSYAYELEYGKDTIEIGKDSLKQGANVVIVDDLLATGGFVSQSIIYCFEKFIV